MVTAEESEERGVQGDPKSLWIMASLWFVAVMLGGIPLLNYANTSASGTVAVNEWPENSAITHTVGSPHVLFFAHPQCPCTRASVRELARALPRVAGPFQLTLVVSDLGADTEPLGILSSEVRTIRSMRHFFDGAAVETARFGVESSGHVLVFAEDGRLVFSGGITASRGHEGGSRAQDDFLRQLRAGDSLPLCEHPVFGCALVQPGEVGEGSVRD